MACEKCGYENKNNKKILVNNKQTELCFICNHFLPNENIHQYLSEKVNWKDLETFRKFSIQKNKIGMQEKAKKGNVVSRPPYGYKFTNKKLVPDSETSLKVQEIFMDFLYKNMNLTQLSKKYGFSVNGIKKILKNFTYIGKVRFSGNVSQGNHKPIISLSLFNKVQSKLDLKSK